MSLGRHERSQFHCCWRWQPEEGPTRNDNLVPIAEGPEWVTLKAIVTGRGTDDEITTRPGRKKEGLNVIHYVTELEAWLECEQQH